MTRPPLTRSQQHVHVTCTLPALFHVALTLGIRETVERRPLLQDAEVAENAIVSGEEKAYNGDRPRGACNTSATLTNETCRGGIDG